MPRELDSHGVVLERVRRAGEDNDVRPIARSSLCQEHPHQAAPFVESTHTSPTRLCYTHASAFLVLCCMLIPAAYKPRRLSVT